MAQGSRVLPVLLLVLSAAGLQFLFPPYYAARRDAPRAFHVALGWHPAWRPPDGGTARAALAARYPADPPPDAERCDVRPNRVRLGLQLVVTGLLGALLGWVRRR